MEVAVAEFPAINARQCVLPTDGCVEHLPEVELTRRVAGGDAEAFEEIYRLHYRQVYGLCLRMTQNVAEAEDITQEVFVLLHRKGQFFPWREPVQHVDLSPHRQPSADALSQEQGAQRRGARRRQGYEHEEVAEILGCAVGTSKSQLHKARVKLRKILNSSSSKETQPIILQAAINTMR